MPSTNLTLIGGALIASNFFWQFISGQQYDVALERSLFQVVALALVWLDGVTP